MFVKFKRKFLKVDETGRVFASIYIAWLPVALMHNNNIFILKGQWKCLRISFIKKKNKLMAENLYLIYMLQILIKSGLMNTYAPEKKDLFCLMLSYYVHFYFKFKLMFLNGSLRSIPTAIQFSLRDYNIRFRYKWFTGFWSAG